MKTLILDFIRLEESHTGVYLAQKLFDCLRDFNIIDKVRPHARTAHSEANILFQVLSIVTDNGANVVNMFTHLDKHLEDPVMLGLEGPVMVGSTTRVMCILHILNLVCQVCPFTNLLCYFYSN